MELSRFPLASGEKSLDSTDREQQGFAVLTLVTLIPLLLTLFVCLGAALFAMKRKSLAQAICVQQATLMQHELKRLLVKLLAMNRRAEILRARRRAADNQLQVARASAIPMAIAAAQAVQTEVILEQTEFHTRQLALLAEARGVREEKERQLRERAMRAGGVDIHAAAYFHRALAVEPNPPFDLSPNYETVPGFTYVQQHSFTYSLDVLSGFPFAFELELARAQNVRCAVSLAERSGDWELEILAARAR